MWTPSLPSKDDAETFQHLVTAVGVILAGAWAFWRWSLSEFLRRRREIPSFDGEISAFSVPVGERRVLLSVSCKWRNVGAVALPVNTKATSFTLYTVPNETPLGPVGPRMGNLRELFVRYPWEHWPGAILEPGTSSDFQAQFLVEAGRPYVVSCRLEAVTKPRSLKQVWVRELVWAEERSHSEKPAA